MCRYHSFYTVLSAAILCHIYRCYALHTGNLIYPNSYAVWIEEVELADAATSLQTREEQVAEVVKTENINNTSQ